MDIQNLTPYKSLILTEFHNAGRAPQSLVADVIDDINNILRINVQGSGLSLVDRKAPIATIGLEVAFVHFTQERKPAWTADPTAVDKTHELALVLRYKHLVAIHLTDSGLRTRVVRDLGDATRPGLSLLKLISRARLNAAFVKGEARTLWLSGIHRRTAIRADSKILSGIDLRDSLNPLDDQTYYFTAARCNAPIQGNDTSLGVAPQKSRVWMGTSKTWKDFRDSVKEVLAHLDQTTGNVDAPFHILASAVRSGRGLTGAFDINFQPPELLEDEPSGNGNQAEDLEKWAYHANFEVTAATGANLNTRLTLKGELLGTVDFTLTLTDPEHVVISATGAPASNDVAELHAQALKHCAKPDWINIRYESGHTISNGAIHSVQYRDIPFATIEWVDFTGIQVDKEKPDSWARLGTDSSLFCWAKNHWPHTDGRTSGGDWLASDDGSMEKADFIYVNDSAAAPMLTLIHVKAAANRSPNREISVSKYEIVTAQAIKNLRELDRQILAGGLQAGMHKIVSTLVWHNRTTSDRPTLLRSLAGLGTNYKRQVVIVQPHVTQAAYNAAVAAPNGANFARLRQLYTLLNGAQLACRGLNAELRVISSQ